jgi:hypothetical protein
MTNSRINLDELIELIHIPEIEFLVRCSFEKAKALHRDRVNQYRNLQNYFKPTQFKNLQIFKNTIDVPLKAYRFTLNRNSQGEFVVSEILPLPSKGHSKSDIITQDIINRIECFNPDEEKVREFKERWFANKMCIVEFAKINEDHVIGHIKECEEERDFIKRREKIQCISISMNHQDSDTNEIYQELFSNMEKFPALRNSIFNHYFFWLPHFENKEEEKEGEGVKPQMKVI